MESGGTSGFALVLGIPAWRAVRDVENIEILNRDNGVPTVGCAHTKRRSILFWRATELDNASLWIYLRIGWRDKRLLRRNPAGGLLDGVVYGLRRERRAILGAADGGVLTNWVRWRIPASADAERLTDELASGWAVAAERPPLSGS